uniref:RING-type domain-containing protein n=1 Tax=Aegilops tauschii subsp. strangulata TaxID=200361 RepID=A0A453QLN9_AEGTS
MAAWKETPCRHRFHGRCVEKWLKAKGSCPMCRRQVVTMPAAAAAPYQFYFVTRPEYG